MFFFPEVHSLLIQSCAKVTLLWIWPARNVLPQSSASHMNRRRAKTADSQPCQDFHACVGFPEEQSLHHQVLCSPFESVHAGVAPRKLVDFFKCCLRENAAGEAGRRSADQTNLFVYSNKRMSKYLLCTHIGKYICSQKSDSESTQTKHVSASCYG